MDAKTRQKLRDQLLDLRAKLSGDIDHIETSALHTPEHTYGIDKIGELGSDNFEQEMSLKRMDCEQDTLRKVEVALKLLETGSGENYGLCEGCQKFISLSRLEAVPYATMCIGCQRETENE